MFKRLGDANEEIFDVLLSKKQLLAALRFIRSIGPGAVAGVSARRFLEAALDANDDVLFYTGEMPENSTQHTHTSALRCCIVETAREVRIIYFVCIVVIN